MLTAFYFEIQYFDFN